MACTHLVRHAETESERDDLRRQLEIERGAGNMNAATMILARLQPCPDPGNEDE